MKFNIIKSDSEISVNFKKNTLNSYVFMPSAAYNGNRFNARYAQYPPMFKEEEFGVDREILITDVPRLSKNLPSKIELTSADMATPCFGLFDSESKSAFLIFLEISNSMIGFTFEEFEIESLLTISATPKREIIYRGNTLKTHIEPEYKDSILLESHVLSFDCDNIEVFFERFFTERKNYYKTKRNNILPFSKAFEMAEKKFNDMNYRDSQNYYGIGTPRNNKFQDWQSGWTGGGISSLPLLAFGNSITKERSVSTLDFAFKYQSKYGLFYGIVYNGKILHDCFEHYEEKYNFILIRKHADILFFILKHFIVMQNYKIDIPKHFDEHTKLAADALCDIFGRYGQIGHFVNAETGEIHIGGSSAGGIAPAALVLAYRRYGNKKYLETAEKLAKLYYTRDTKNGISTGGPGEILQSLDSESAFGMLESYIVLYEETKDIYWLNASKSMAYQCSSWVMSYDFTFPKTSEFGRLDIKTCGSVFANIQNKHSAPGICTLSASALLKLYRYTKDVKFLELVEDISAFTPQCMSRNGYRIHSWDAEPKPLPNGFICERVNTSDWEGPEKVGGVFNGSCWSETSQMLTYLEIPSIYIDKENLTLAVSDHINAKLIANNKLEITNPTEFNAQISILCDDYQSIDKDLGAVYYDKFKNITINSHQTITIDI